MARSLSRSWAYSAAAALLARRRPQPKVVQPQVLGPVRAALQRDVEAPTLRPLARFARCSKRLLRGSNSCNATSPPPSLARWARTVTETLWDLRGSTP